MPSIEDIARRFGLQFETHTPERGEPFMRVKSGAPDHDELQALIRTIHRGGEVFPLDVLYALTAAAFDHLAYGGDPDDGSDFADSSVDVYTGDLVKWLAEAPGYHMSLVDDAIAEMGPDQRPLSNLLQLGQYRQAEEVFAEVVEFVRSRADDEEESDDPADIEERRIGTQELYRRQEGYR